VQLQRDSPAFREVSTSVNNMASSIRTHMSDIKEISRRIAQSDLSEKVTVDAKGELLHLKDTINTKIDHLIVLIS
jgi:methyl-accepting chemotaxis protein